MKKSEALEKFKTLLLEKRKEGKVIFYAMNSLMECDLDEFIKQPADGILYDLNRLEEVSFTFMETNQKWINDFAVAMVIRKLKEFYDEHNQLMADRSQRYHAED